jgi:hypothetical protein
LARFSAARYASLMYSWAVSGWRATRRTLRRTTLLGFAYRNLERAFDHYYERARTESSPRRRQGSARRASSRGRDLQALSDAHSHGLGVSATAIAARRPAPPPPTTSTSQVKLSSPRNEFSYPGQKCHQGIHKLSHCCLLLRLATVRPGGLHRAAAPAVGPCSRRSRHGQGTDTDAGVRPRLSLRAARLRW